MKLNCIQGAYRLVVKLTTHVQSAEAYREWQVLSTQKTLEAVIDESQWIMLKHFAKHSGVCKSRNTAYYNSVYGFIVGRIVLYSSNNNSAKEIYDPL